MKEGRKELILLFSLNIYWTTAYIYYRKTATNIRIHFIIFVDLIHKSK